MPPSKKRIGRVSRGGEPLVLAACAVVTSDMNKYYTGVAGLARKSRYCLEGVAVLILHEDKMESKSQDPVPYIGQTGWAFWIPQKSAGYNHQCIVQRKWQCCAPMKIG